MGRKNVPDPAETRDTRQDWYETLSHHLSKEVHESLKALRRKKVAERAGKTPDLLQAEIARIERAWKLM
jgi:hypothetical protein